MAASCSAGEIKRGEIRIGQSVKAGCRFITLGLDLPSVAIPNISFSVLTSEKFREHHFFVKEMPVFWFKKMLFHIAW